MAEIQLPTKATQDAIKIQTDKLPSVKSDTTSILSKLPAIPLSIKSKQKGIVANGVATIDVTIQPVNAAGNIFIEAWLVSTNGSYYSNTQIRGEIINSTTLRLYGNTTNSNISTEWKITEFN